MDKEHFQEKIRQIVLLLPDVWREDKTKEFFWNRIEFINDGKRLCFQIGREPGKVQVSGRWPYHQNTPFNPKYCGLLDKEDFFYSVGFSLSRNPKAISRDIQRRYINQYLEYYDQCLEFVKKKEQEQNNFRIQIDLLKRHFNLRENGISNNSQIYLYTQNHEGIRADLTVSRYGVTHADIELNDVPYDAIFEVMELLKRRNQKEKKC